MIKQFFKLLTKTVKKTTASVGKSMEFIDDTLEKEHIISAAEKTKAITSAVINKAGEAYQHTKNTIDEITQIDQVANVIDKANDIKGTITVKASELIESGREKVEANDTLKSAMDKIFETSNDLAESISEKATNLSKDIENSIFGEEEE